MWRPIVRAILTAGKFFFSFVPSVSVVHSLGVWACSLGLWDVFVVGACARRCSD